MSVLLKNANLVHEDGINDVLITDGNVKVLKEGESGEAERVVDLEGRIVIRGFADTHMHLDKALIAEKVVNDSGTLKEAIDIMSDYKPSMSDDDIRKRMKQVIDWAYQNGTRFLRTNIDIDDGIGLRSFRIFESLKEEYKDKMVLESVAFPQEGFLENERNFELLEEALKEGADVLGGIPAFDPDPRKHIERLMDLAVKYDVDVDMHVDESDDPNDLSIRDLIHFTEKHNYSGRVTAAHLCSLAANDPESIQPILEGMKQQGIHVVSLPSTNLYLQGRGDEKNIRRGITPIRKMIHEHGINVAIGSDNVRDPFNCFGNAKPLESALIAAHGAHMGASDDLKALFNSVSLNGLKIMNIDPSVENSDHLVVIDATNERNAITAQSDVYGYLENGKFVKNQ